MNPQYIACRFNPKHTRTYTYVNNGAPVTVGDQVKVPDPQGGWKAVEVTAIVSKPTFECKPILGKVSGQDVDDRLAAINARADDLFGGNS